MHFEASEVDALEFVPRDQAYWRRGPVRPVHSVVVISPRDFDLHRSRDLCQAPDCPQEILSAVALTAPLAGDGGVR